MIAVPLLALLGAVASGALAKSNEFTSQDMLSAPRPQAGIVSPDRTQSISVVDQWNPDADSMNRTIYLVSLDGAKAGKKGSEITTLLSCPPGHAGNFLWVDDKTIAYLNDTTLYSFPLSPAYKPVPALDFPRGVSPTRLQYVPEKGMLVFQGQVWQDGDFGMTEEKNGEYEKRGTTGEVYDELFLRHWDTWRIPGKVWTIGTVAFDGTSSLKNKKKPIFTNILNGTGLESKMDPHGSVAVSSRHIAFTVKSKYLNYATHTREDVYLLPLESALVGVPQGLTPHDHGAISGLAFSPDGKKLGWLEMDEDGYESDKRTVVVYDLKNGGHPKRWTDGWDQSPTSISWSVDSKSLFLVAEHHGRVLPYHISDAGQTPTQLYNETSTSAITPLSKSSLFLSMSSLISPTDDFILDLDAAAAQAKEHEVLRKVTDWSKDHIGDGFDDLTIEELWTKGADNWDVMSWVLKPKAFDSAPRGSWPLAFFVHGGPQAAWEDAWSTRWNPALFAKNGYIVVAVNPTGSTGYGQEFCDKMKEDWGGAPFKDLLASYQAALATYPQIDKERTAMLGGSYGGYMANWIQGHNDQFGFQAIVCHDGIFSTTSAFYETEEVWFPTREFNGDPTRQRAMFEKWNPMNHVAEWSTPELVIHSGKDFRLIDGQGIAAFTALQVQGVPSRFLYFPDENHWVLKPSNSMKWHHEVFKWLEEWTGKGEKKIQGEDVGTPRLVIQA